MEKQNKIELSSFWLHIIAIITMLCDHIWAVFLSGHTWMTCIGRISFPIFSFMIVEGYFHTRSLKKYIGRLLIFAVISEIPYDLAFGGRLFYLSRQNVLWTFLISVFVIHCIEKTKKNGSFIKQIIFTIAALLFGGIVAFLIFSDYYYVGILIVLTFYFFREQKWWCYVGQLVSMLYLNFELLGGSSYEIPIDEYILFLPLQGFAVLSLIFIWAYKGKQGYHSRWLQYIYYSFYPAHLLIFALFNLAI